VVIHHGDCLVVLPTLDADSVDAVVTDPPYGLGFMGKEWDGGGVAFDPATWEAVARVLKPGGHLVAFGGTRTFHRLACAIEDAGFEIRDCLSWLYGSGFPKSLDVSKAIDKAAGAEREATREATRSTTAISWDQRGSGERARFDLPATEEARQWEGWGTALKPAYEPVIVAQKPYDLQAILAIIGSHLDRLETEWQAQAADPTTLTGAAAGSLDLTATSPSGSETTTCWNIVSSWRACWADLCGAMSTSTIGTTTRLTTDLRTLSSCLSRITLASIRAHLSRPPGSMPLVSGADALFGSVVLSTRAILALSADAPAIDSTPLGFLAAVEGSSSPAWEPIILARKPLSERSVAANVLRHGTGGVNVDACRIGTGGEKTPAPLRRGDSAPWFTTASQNLGGNDTLGRWPANVVLDEEAARLLDEQGGERPSGSRVAGVRTGLGYHGANGDGGPAIEGSAGGAARFFYTAKADSAERSEGLGKRNAHPTVKPLSLMAWLVKLVTPPGGTVLDPFLGSGTTAIACLGNGFSCIGIEREAEYVEIAADRIGLGCEVVA
jgi:DNA modification methylase